MERDTTRFPESRPSAAETDGTSGSLSKKSKEKKTDLSAAPLAAEAPAREIKPESVAKIGSLWERMMAKPEAVSTESGVKSESQKAERQENRASETKDDTEASDEALAQLDDAETRSATASIVNEELAEVRTQQATREEGDPEAGADEAVAQFLEQADTNLHAEDAPGPAEALDRAYIDTLADFGIEDTGDASGNPMTPEIADDDDENSAAARFGQSGGGQGRGTIFGTAGNVPFGTTRTPGYASEARARTNESSAVAGGFIIGGIVGYLLGRRRGRINTEARLKPIQEKLETQVSALYANVAAKEARIRELALEREQIRRSERASAPNIAEQSGAQTRAPEKPASLSSHEAPRPAPANAEKMNLQQVLELSDEIVIGATTVRKIFETNLISERGLRRVVNEFLQGKDHLPVLAAELAAKDRDHELDPHLRDRPPEIAGSNAVSGTQQTSHAAASQAIGAGMPAGLDAAKRLNTNGTVGQAPDHRGLMIANFLALVILGTLVIILLAIWLLH